MAQDYLDGRNTIFDETTALRDAMRCYIDTRKGIIQQTTIRTYNILAENAFKCLQKTRLCDLRPIDIQRAISIEIERKNKSAKYVKNAYGLLKSVLKMFEVDVNLSSVKLPKVVRKEKELPEFETICSVFPISTLWSVAVGRRTTFSNQFISRLFRLNALKSMRKSTTTSTALLRR